MQTRPAVAPSAADLGPRYAGFVPLRGFASLTLLLAFGGACAFTDLSGFTTPGSNDGAIAGDGGPLADGAAAPGAEGGSAPDASSQSSYASVVLADKPVLYFRFDEDATAKAVIDDIAGRKAPTTPHARPGAGGVSGHGLSLDGDGELNVGDVFDFDGKRPFALEAWVRVQPHPGVDQHVFNKRTDPTPDMLGYILYVGEDGSAHFEGWGAELSAWTETPIPTEFTHVVVSVAYDTSQKGNASLWINGQVAPKGGWDNTSPLPNTTAPLLIGPGVIGELDEVAIYDHDLSEARIRAHYTAGKP
jgi:hypothetical protein